MKRLLLLPYLFAGTSAFAHLAPTTTAPLHAHLLEVNAEWRSHTSPLLHEAASFGTDVERIAQHLHLVHDHLATHSPAGLSAQQTTERTRALAVLERYAEQARFPRNYILPYRNPIFIDRHGTACAVGHLMIESGHRALAERIDAEMELAYIREIDIPEVAQWAAAHGFTTDELAWIQPAYQPVIEWFTLGGGTNGEVQEVLRLTNGNLLVAGSFTDAGGAACNGAAIWNGTSYTPLGALPDGRVNCALEFDGGILLGGYFNNGATDLLRWNGTTWTEDAVFASKSAEVTALHALGTQLYAAGASEGFVGTDYGVRTLVSGNWQPVATVLNGPIQALEHFNDVLVAAGEFTDEFLQDDDALMHVVKLTNAGWEQLAGGLDGRVFDLLVQDGQLYATGDMVSMAGTSFGLARIDVGLTAWQPMMPNIQNYIYPSPVDAPSIGYAMVATESRIFITGMITYSQALIYGSGVIAFNGTPDGVEVLCDFQGVGQSIALHGSNQLVVGGGSAIYDNIISTDLAAGVGTQPEKLQLALAPNPAQDLLTVQLPNGMDANATLRLTDASGRIVTLPYQRTAHGVVMDVHELAAGSYQLEIDASGRTAIGRFVKG